MKAHTQFLISEEHERIVDLINILQSKERSTSFRSSATIEQRKALRVNLNTLIAKKKRIEMRANQKIVGYSRN